MNFEAPKNVIITLPFEVESADETRQKGYLTVTLRNLTTAVNEVVGTLTLVSDNGAEPITVSLVTADGGGGGGGWN